MKSTKSLTIHINPNSSGIAFGSVTADFYIGSTDDNGLLKRVTVTPSLDANQTKTISDFFTTVLNSAKIQESIP